jgi:hypothetical protein
MANFNYDGFEVRIKFSAMLGDFCSFSDQLESFYKTLGGQAKFKSIEDNVSFQLSTDGLGHIDINGYLRHHKYVLTDVVRPRAFGKFTGYMICPSNSQTDKFTFLK